MKLSLPWYLTNYSEGLHTYYYILSKCSTQVSVNLIDGLSINRGKETTVFLDLSFQFIQIFSNFEVTPCQKATTLILISLYNPSFHL